jgi:hypothetical protein
MVPHGPRDTDPLSRHSFAQVEGRGRGARTSSHRGSGLRTDLPLPREALMVTVMRLPIVKPLSIGRPSRQAARRIIPTSDGASGGLARSVLRGTGPRTESRAARHPVNPSPRRRSRVLTGGPLESSVTRRLPALRGHRRDGDAPAASMRWTEWASRSISHTVPSVETRTHDERRAPVRARATPRAANGAYAFSVAPSGMTPCATDRQSALASVRARAAMPMRVLRPPAAPKRR